MTFEKFKTGAVFRYSYLWGHEADRGETEGRKERPVTIAIRLRQKFGRDRFIFFPITSKMPEAGRFASELPESEKRRAGLDPALRLWIILDDVNVDQIGKSFYLRDQEPLGRLSRSYFMPLVLEFIARKEAIKATDRTR
jgi:hypothetical protein